LATPTRIPVKCDRNSTTIEGICKTTMLRSTEYMALYPKRGSAWDTRLNAHIAPRPHYYDADGVLRYKIWCGACAEYQRRDAFSDDLSHPSGKRRYCKTCESAKASQRYHRRKALHRNSVKAA